MRDGRALVPQEGVGTTVAGKPLPMLESGGISWAGGYVSGYIEGYTGSMALVRMRPERPQFLSAQVGLDSWLCASDHLDSGIPRSGWAGARQSS